MQSVFFRVAVKLLVVLSFMAEACSSSHLWSKNSGFEDLTTSAAIVDDEAASVTEEGSISSFGQLLEAKNEICVSDIRHGRDPKIIQQRKAKCGGSTPPTKKFREVKAKDFQCVYIDECTFFLSSQEQAPKILKEDAISILFRKIKLAFHTIISRPSCL